MQGSAGLQRWVLALMLVPAVGCQAEIETGLDETQANDVVVTLHGQGIGAEKRRSEGTGEEARFDVLVASDDVGPALTVLRSADVPRQDQPGLTDVFGEGSLVPTATEERARYTAALGGELARSIERIDGVLDARVHVALPDSRRFALDEEPPHPRASVLIRHRAGEPPYSDNAVKALVAGAVQGMQPEDVAVVGVAAPAPPETPRALVHIGPIAVTRGSAPALKGVLAGALGLHVVLALCLVVVVMRRRRVQAEAEG